MANLIRFPMVKAKTGGLSRSTIWRLESKGFFPKRRVITTKIVVWDEAEVDEWVHNQNKGVGLVPGTRKADLIAQASLPRENSGVRE